MMMGLYKNCIFAQPIVLVIRIRDFYRFAYSENMYHPCGYDIKSSIHINNQNFTVKPTRSVWHLPKQRVYLKIACI